MNRGKSATMVDTRDDHSDDGHLAEFFKQQALSRRPSNKMGTLAKMVQIQTQVMHEFDATDDDIEEEKTLVRQGEEENAVDYLIPNLDKKESDTKREA